jgi:hypothetical protein
VRIGKDALMYVGGAVGLLVFIFAVLMIFGVVPFTHQTVGALLAVLCVGFVGPFVVRT